MTSRPTSPTSTARTGNTFADRGVVNHSAKEYVLGTDYTNTVEGFFSILKRGIYGCYFHVSEAHLHRYLSEFDFRYSNRISRGRLTTAPGPTSPSRAPTASG